MSPAPTRIKVFAGRRPGSDLADFELSGADGGACGHNPLWAAKSSHPKKVPRKALGQRAIRIHSEASTALKHTGIPSGQGLPLKVKIEPLTSARAPFSEKRSIED